MKANQYLLGGKDLATQLGCEILPYDNIIKYTFQPDSANSWIRETSPAPGLVVTRTYFKPFETITKFYSLPHSCLWLCSFDSGSLTIIEKGKKARQLQPGMHLIIHHNQPVKVIFSASERLVYTSITVCDHFITTCLPGRSQEQVFAIKDALAWKREQYNTPDIMMVFDQLKQSLMNGCLPLIYYESKAIEILTLIQRNASYKYYWERHLQSERKNHLTYQNRKFIWKVKDQIDKDILHPPKIEQLALLAEMSITKLNRYFKLWYKVTIADYIRREKMSYAMRLLWDDDKSIRNIASVIGYENASKFSIAFKKIHGFSPRHIRKSFGL